jgi:nicotinamidase/pyrazinamidase
LCTAGIKKIIYKGTDPRVDSYSAFFDNKHLRSTGLGDYLLQEGVKEVYIMGLATDYCVKYSCLDACKLGFTVYVIEEACRGVELVAGDVVNAFNEMRSSGVSVIQAGEILREK